MGGGEELDALMGAVSAGLKCLSFYLGSPHGKAPEFELCYIRRAFTAVMFNQLRKEAVKGSADPAIRGANLLP